jgi:undecaprenyl-diphosphatase
MIIITILLLILFILWAINMKKGNLTKIDTLIYKKIKFKNIKTILLKIITTFASSIFLILMGLIIFLTLKNRKLAWIIIILLISECILNWTLKQIFKRERPNIKRLVNEKGYSFPSGHTTSATCFYGFIIFLISISSFNILLKLLFIILLISFIISIGYSRIYLGVHYFSDVVGGLLFGSSYLIIYVYFIHFLLNII